MKNDMMEEIENVEIAINESLGESEFFSNIPDFLIYIN